MRILIICIGLPFTIFAQLDSCGKDFRPIPYLNHFEVEFLNEAVTNKPVAFDESMKIAFVAGVGKSGLIETKHLFFKGLSQKGKELVKAELSLLTPEEKEFTNGYDAILLFEVLSFEGDFKQNVLKNLRNDVIQNPSIERIIPFNNSYVGMLQYIDKYLNHSSLHVIQDSLQIQAIAKSEYFITYDFAELAFEEHEICYEVNYQTTDKNSNNTVLAIANLQFNWLEVSSDTFVSKHSIHYQRVGLKRKNKKAEIFKMVIQENALDGTIHIRQTAEEMPWEEYKAIKRKNKK